MFNAALASPAKTCWAYAVWRALHSSSVVASDEFCSNRTEFTLYMVNWKPKIWERKRHAPANEWDPSNALFCHFHKRQKDLPGNMICSSCYCCMIRHFKNYRYGLLHCKCHSMLSKALSNKDTPHTPDLMSFFKELFTCMISVLERARCPKDRKDNVDLYWPMKNQFQGCIRIDHDRDLFVRPFLRLTCSRLCSISPSHMCKPKKPLATVSPASPSRPYCLSTTTTARSCLIRETTRLVDLSISQSQVSLRILFSTNKNVDRNTLSTRNCFPNCVATTMLDVEIAQT